MISSLTPLDLEKYLIPNAKIDRAEETIPTCEIHNWSDGMLANADFFGHPKYSEQYLKTENCSRAFGERWQAAIGSWDDKVVIDIGCGPGNLYATIGGTPQVLIGIDISRGALEKAMQLGYTPILADAHNLPLIDDCADIVALNAVLHHCDDMVKVLTEAARVVIPGGLLITDEDPQRTAWHHKGLGWLVDEARKLFPLYWLPGRGHLYRSKQERALRLATEIHNRKPGDGVTPELYYRTLEPLGFTIELYPHNHGVGAELFQGNYGRSPLKYTLAQRLSGINPNSPEAAQSVMCIARKLVN
ncbi:class I SAM-dependent methyltransferase [Chamaesiphon sp. VAR_48_metabat_135_sub]|uniref:class I SAM-dependent methyltransferase n=1 Tax=Chamaesiphon sp. VAR_48_metabat_135_sub TaxID=2964699 RepID=UPI00286C3BD4|nr:class I SAM-dependent methyltransferase [Chamaesiphon sp. VAR_48_metabat_135_sub]